MELHNQIITMVTTKLDHLIKLRDNAFDQGEIARYNELVKEVDDTQKYLDKISAI